MNKEIEKELSRLQLLSARYKNKLRICPLEIKKEEIKAFYIFSYIKDLQHQLEEKEKLIDEVFNYVCEDCPYSVAWKDDEEYKKVYKLCDCKNCQEDYKKCWLKYLENEAKAINK